MSAVEEVPSPAPRLFTVEPGPHVRTDESTAGIMWWVNGALAPAALWGVFVFGVPALLVMLGAIAGAVLTEWGVGRLMAYREGPLDGSAFCTGLLLAMTLPPRVAPWMAFLGGAFAIGVGKMLFGGLGDNLFNPALLGRAFLMATFPLPLTAGWMPPRPMDIGLDAVTTATPLAAFREKGLDAALSLVGGPDSHLAGLLLGFRPGSIGEVSILLLFAGAGVLLWRRILSPTIPLAILAGVTLTTAFTGALSLHLLSGGLWLGALFMATDYVTSPRTRNGQIVYGLVIGVLTGLIRVYGGYPEGICYAILLANTLVPAFDTWFRPPRPVATAWPGSPS